MRTETRRCFNNHSEPRDGCAGCHHAFHVLAPGAVRGGELISPRVIGPLECALCHDALHAVPVRGCGYCDVTFVETVAAAMETSKDARMELIGLRLMHWLVGWHARVLGWAAIVSGRAFTDLFSSGNGSTNWGTLIFSMVAVPAAQAVLTRQIERKERQLPRLGPNGEIVYGEPG